MYCMRIACNKNQSHYCNKIMFVFLFDRLSWAYYVQETLNPKVKVLPHISLFFYHIHQGCYLTRAWLPEAPTIYPRATKISNREPKWAPKTYDSLANFR